MTAFSVPREIRILLDIPNDPHAFVEAAFQKWHDDLATIHNRVMERMNLVSVTLEDANPSDPGKQKATVSMRASGSESRSVTAAKMAIGVVNKNLGAIYLDEARRWSIGQPVLKGSTRSLDNGESVTDPGDMLDDTIFRALSPSFSGVKHFDPVTITVLVGVVVPLLVVAIPIVLPLLFTAGKAAFDWVATNVPAVGNVIDGIIGKKETPPPAPPPDEGVGAFLRKHKVPIIAGSVGVSLLGLLFVVTRKRG